MYVRNGIAIRRLLSYFPFVNLPIKIPFSGFLLICSISSYIAVYVIQDIIGQIDITTSKIIVFLMSIELNDPSPKQIMRTSPKQSFIRESI